MYNATVSHYSSLFFVETVRLSCNPMHRMHKYPKSNSNWAPAHSRTSPLHLIIQLEARLQTNINWIHFTACFGSVPAFGYNSAESEPIWMKSGALREHCWGWPWQILGAIRTVASAGVPGEMVSKARCHRFPVGQISRNLNTTRRSV